MKIDFAASDDDPESTGMKLSCGKAISDIESEISVSLQVPIKDQRKVDADTPYSDRRKSYDFTLGGAGPSFTPESDSYKRMADLLNDSERLSGYSRIIIEACPDIGLVSYGARDSDWIVNWYYKPEGVVQEQCVPHGNQLPGWGWGYCD